MTQEKSLDRRKFLLGAAAVSFAMLNLGGDCDGKTSRQERLDGFKEGEWIAHERYTIIISTAGDPSIKAVNVRSHWDINKKEAELKKLLAGSILPGTMLESVGQVKGNAGWMDPVFFVVTKNELSLLVDQGRFTPNLEVILPDGPSQSYFYINNTYVDIFQPSASKEIKE
jgi:hypothetical protein